METSKQELQTARRNLTEAKDAHTALLTGHRLFSTWVVLEAQCWMLAALRGLRRHALVWVLHGSLAWRSRPMHACMCCCCMYCVCTHLMSDGMGFSFYTGGATTTTPRLPSRGSLQARKKERTMICHTFIFPPHKASVPLCLHTDGDWWLAAQITSGQRPPELQRLAARGQVRGILCGSLVGGRFGMHKRRPSSNDLESYRQGSKFVRH